MKKYLLFSVVIGMTTACSTEQEKTPEENKKAMEQREASRKKINERLEKQEAELYSWQYSETKDEMTEKVTSTAYIESRDVASLKFPYEGGTTMRLWIRKKDGVQDAYIVTTNGQIHDDFDNKTLSIRFDDDKPIDYTVLESADANPEYRFIASANKFIDRLKTAKKVKIQVQFYNNGSHTYSFDVSGLKW